MSLKNFRLESKLLPNYQIKKDNYYLLYALDNNLVLKKFLLNDEYYEMLKKHQSDYLEYLRMLMNNSSNMLVKPIDIYAKHSLVTSYTYFRPSGTNLLDMYPKTKLDKLIEAIDEFYNQIAELSGFDLRVLKPTDILYTGSIKISGLDESEYTTDNIDMRLINDLLFRGIFKISNDDEITIDNEDILNLYKKLEISQIDILEFMNEYIRFIKSEYGNCKYVKHLNRNIISSKK